MTSRDEKTTDDTRPDREVPEVPGRPDSAPRRLPVEGNATAFELSGHHFGQMHSLRQLAFTNAGLEADSDDGIACGITVTVGFQAGGQSARRGRVTACERRKKAYHIAIAVAVESNARTGS